LSASLIFRLAKVIPFGEVLRDTRYVLSDLLKLETVPPLRWALPPQQKGSAVSLEERLIDPNFPGAYIEFQGEPESRVNLHVFEGGRASKDHLVGVGAVSTAASEVLAAALAAATVRLMGNIPIGDYGHNWVAKDDCAADELVAALSLQNPQCDFIKAIELVHRKQAIHDRHSMKP
jgi:hypothetical protein